MSNETTMLSVKGVSKSFGGLKALSDVGIEVKKREDFDKVKTQMTENNFKFTYLNETPDLFTHLIG